MMRSVYSISPVRSEMMDDTMVILVGLLYLLLSATADDGNFTHAPLGYDPSTKTQDGSWENNSNSENISGSSPVQTTSKFPTSAQLLTDGAEHNQETFTMLTVYITSSEGLHVETISPEREVVSGEYPVMPVGNSTVKVPNTSDEWPATGDGYPEDNDVGALSTSVAIDANGGNGASATGEGFAWSSILWNPLVIIQMIFSLLGVFGNALVIAVLYQHRAANRVTDTLIGNLAAADLLTSLFVIPIPRVQHVPGNWEGQVYCKVVQSSVLMWANMAVSTYLLVAISIERYLAVVHPVYFSMILSRRRVESTIVLIWVVNYVINGIFAYFVVNSFNGRCTMIFTKDFIGAVTGTALFLYRVFFPSLIMVITQVLIARKLYHQAVWFRSNAGGAASKGNVHLAARSRIIKLMLVVIMIYVLCWLPSQVGFLLYTTSVIPPWYPYSIYHRILTLFGFFNSCVNPIIYTLRHEQFRQAIADLFKRDLPVTKSVPLFGRQLNKRQHSQGDV
ncbi:allatostatin-A receptor-like [Lytechinus variegatus]|uniref:allatostatin-A receptor-like n=1 Tax=Lytechinus variegatus TaxID=7654 RepID=UPI001BB14745|nr:allatostatin-A receptor-like [Lytechinus variegatus]